MSREQLVELLLIYDNEVDRAEHELTEMRKKMSIMRTQLANATRNLTAVRRQVLFDFLGVEGLKMSREGLVDELELHSKDDLEHVTVAQINALAWLKPVQKLVFIRLCNKLKSQADKRAQPIQ